MVKPTLKRMGVALGVYTLGAGIVLLIVEVWGIRGGVSISHTITSMWNYEPWVIVAIMHLLGFAWGFLCGHWFGGPRPVRDRAA